MKINFICFEPDSNEKHIMHTQSDKIAVMMGSETDEVIEELSKSLL